MSAEVPKVASSGTAPAVPNPAIESLVRRGVHPEAAKRLVALGWTPPHVSQGVGSARASAGTHAPDGAAGGHPYSAATDLRTTGLSDAELRLHSRRLAAAGFVPFVRKTGMNGWTGASHLHIVFCGAPMKRSLRDQVHDFLRGRDGLVNGQRYAFWSPDAREAATLRDLFLRHNPPNG